MIKGIYYCRIFFVLFKSCFQVLFKCTKDTLVKFNFKMWILYLHLSHYSSKYYNIIANVTLSEHICTSFSICHLYL